MFAAARGQGKPARDADAVRDEDADWLSVGQSFQGKTREKDANQTDNVNERALKVYKKSSHKKKKKRRTSKWSDEDGDERGRGKKRKKESKHKKRKNETRHRRSYSSSSSTSASEDEDRQSRREDKASRKRRRRGSSEDRMVRAKDEWELVDMHDDATEVYKKAPGDDKLFEFDCAGDRDNLLYGSLYVHEQPLYHLATKRSVIDGKWTVPKQKPRLLGSGRQESEEKREERYFGPTRRKMEKIMGQRRLHLAYSERRMDRSQQQSTELAYIPVGPILDGELAGVAGEENGDDEDGDDSLLMQTDLERIEEYLVTKGKALNEKVNAEPQNIEAWLDLIAFQQQSARLLGAKKRDPDKAVVLEKQRAVLIKALEHNPSSSELRRFMLNMMMVEMKGSGRSASMSSEEYRKHIETMLENDPINADLWVKLIELSQQKFSTFSVPMIRDLYARTVSVLSKELTKRITGEDPSTTHKTAISSVQVFSSGSLLQASRDPYEDKDLDPRAASLSTTLMEFHSGMATMESKAGYVERAVGHLVALSAFNDMKSSESKPLNHQEMVQRFGAQLGQSDLLAWIRETSGFACFPRYVPQPESLTVFLSAKTKLDRILERINPSNELRMPQHGPSLSSPGHLRFDGVVGAEDTPDNAVSDDNETAQRGKWVYSNLHGYRIWVGEADDAQEYERILQELRGTEDSQMRQVAIQQKLQKKQSRVQASLMALRDERAEYPDVPESDTFVQWISEEIAAQAVQWEPLQASNPHHAEVIEEQPDRAILTEELQPFLFRVHKSHRIDIIFGILRTMGVQLAWDEANSVESQYGDDFDYCQMLSQPILEALESTHSSSLLLKPGERLALLRQHICTDVQVSQQALIDPERVQFIRSLFVLALQKATPDKEQVRGIKALWIGYETQVLVRMKDREAAIDNARSFCQELLASDQLAPQSPIDAGVMFAYAKMELSLGNDKQVARICEKTLSAIIMSSESGSPRSQDFHRLIYLRVRGELKDLKEGNARDPKPSVKLLRAFYVLQSVWSPQGEQIDRFAKKYRGAGLRTALQEILTQKRNETIDRYRMELEVAINQCAKHCPKRHHLSLDRVTMCPVGFCLYNLCMAIYIAHGYGAAHQEFQEFLSQTSLTQVPCHGRFCWYLHLEFMEAHQVNVGFPWVAPREWRGAVEQSVQRFPTDPLFLRLFVDAEANNPMSQKIQRYFHQVKHRRQRYMDSPSVVEWLFVLHYEFGRAERSADKDSNTGDGDVVPTQTCCLFHRWRKNLPAVERVRRVFEDMVDQVDTRGNALCWRLFLRFEIAMGKVEAARKVFYRALASCPWSKELYLDGIRVLRAYLTEGECREIQEFMIAKELHDAMKMNSQERSYRLVSPNNVARTNHPCQPRLNERVSSHHDGSTCVERLQSISGIRVSAHEVLLEMLPNQASVIHASALMDRKAQSPQREERLRLQSRFRRKNAPPTLSPLVTSESSSISTMSPTPENLPSSWLRIWEDKFMRLQLTISDTFFLLVKSDLAAIIEGAVFLRAIRLSSEQVLQAEMVLEQVKSHNGGSTQHEKTSARPFSTASVFRLLHMVASSSGTAFQDRREENRCDKAIISIKLEGRPILSSVRAPPSPLLRVASRCPTKRHPPSPIAATRFTRTGIRSPLNQDEFDRLTVESELVRENLCNLNRVISTSGQWIRDRCIDDLSDNRSTLPSEIRKQYALEKLLRVLSKRVTAWVQARFDVWYRAMLARKYEQGVFRFCRLKGAQMLLVVARRVLRHRAFKLWKIWLWRYHQERKLERFAATVTIQSWIRMVLAQRRVNSYKVNNSATQLQAAWRGFYCRKMLIRRKRFDAYSIASVVIQHAFRTFHNRCQFAIHWGRHKASMRITRSLRRYCFKRRMFRAWCHRVARFHSAAVIQIWMRRTLHRIRENREFHRQRNYAAHTLQRFFRYTRFMLAFGSRVRRLLQQKTAAAIRLQNAYRAKMARARFYSLKDHLEEQRRREILQFMWENAYATTIQRWWRHNRARQSHHETLVNPCPDL